MRDDDSCHRTETMRRTLNARCKGLIEVHRGHVVTPVYGDQSVSYLHHTARDFIESENYWPTVLQITGRASFKPEERWANAHLWLHKTAPFLDPKHLLLGKCITDARILQKKTGLIQKPCLDEVCRAQYVHRYRRGLD
jgi:hypothetical protein